ncbi:hypothetical protein R54876_GBNLAHCA_00715 [Eupransor demetentiae]|uniref:DNA-binding protein n=1 Tax=Eupransor demetentiae TaxID=3109584 RepID=A0ABM9N4P6_9LACO|nr:hypothetical protein R54876_GBNLAHCA_00715 [Lactobacillaceae bacterium LMG 33000]
MKFDINKKYTQKEVCQVLDINPRTFVRHYRDNRMARFPKPILRSKTQIEWDGLALHNFFYRKANK